MLIRTMKQASERGLDAAFFAVIPHEVLFWLKYQGHPRINKFELELEFKELRGTSARVGIHAPGYFRLLPGDALSAANLDFEHHSRDAWELVPAASKRVIITRAGINQLIEDELSFSDEARFRKEGVDRWTEEEATAFSRKGAKQFVVVGYFWVAELCDFQKVRFAWRSSLSGEHVSVSMVKISNMVSLN